MNETEGNPRRRRQRSSYPGAGCQASVEKARRLYNHEGSHETPIEAAMSHMGYTATSGPGRVLIAALKKYGLIDTTTKRGKGTNVQLTERALAIFEDDRVVSIQRDAAIRDTALAPAIHQALWEHFHLDSQNLPSDENALYYLRRERGFTERAAKACWQTFREAFAYAKLGERTPETPEAPPAPDQAAQPSGASVNETIPVKQANNVLPLPLLSGQVATLQYPPDVSNEDFDWLLQMLKQLRNAVVNRKEESGVSGANDDGEE